MSQTEQSLSVLGATGSIGDSTLDLVRRSKGQIRVVALTANRSVAKLAALAKEFTPEFVAVADRTCAKELSAALEGTGIRCGAGPNALIEAANLPSDRVMAAIIGAAGLAPTLTALRRGTILMLANKECLVCAGELMIAEAKACGSTLLPVDSEHNAIFQVLDQDRTDKVSRLILTGSGGPFRGSSMDRLHNVTPAEAIKHPNWSMGAKISVDSATLMNKGLEVIEAAYLFGMDPDMIDVVIHPQSIIHSMVEYVDGSILAQLGSADMRVPIASCLAWPNRMETQAERLDFKTLRQLTFEEPDRTAFPCLKLAEEALTAGGTAPLVLNASNEIAVDAFLNKGLPFTKIPAIVEDCLRTQADTKPPHSIETVAELDRDARRFATDRVRLVTG